MANSTALPSSEASKRPGVLPPNENLSIGKPTVPEGQEGHGQPLNKETSGSDSNNHTGSNGLGGQFFEVHHRVGRPSLPTLNGFFLPPKA